MNKSNNEEEIDEISDNSEKKELPSGVSFKSKLKDKIGGGKERLGKFASKIKVKADETKEKAKFKLEERKERKELEKAEREAREKAEREAREKAEREAKEKAEKEAEERRLMIAKQKAEKEAREKEAREVAEKMAKFKAEKEAEITIKKAKKIICQMCGAINDSSRKNCVTCHSILN
ncbi:MAG: hypothetical protein ACFFDH_05625 [Promethearchaeota archaeon]